MFQIIDLEESIVQLKEDLVNEREEARLEKEKLRQSVVSDSLTSYNGCKL